MNYVISFWLPPDAGPVRESALRAYFDLQRASKARFGANQLIVTNIDYENAIAFDAPPGFSREYGLLAKYFGLGQIIEAGYEFPIAMHDHDTFIRARLPHDPEAILCGSAPLGQFSEQCVVFPESSKAALVNYIAQLQTFDFPKMERPGSAARGRHQGMYSTEAVKGLMQPDPFAGLTLRPVLRVHDMVSFDIGGQNSLDSGCCEARPIRRGTQAVHGHINKGPASQLLMDWLDDRESKP